MKLKTANVIQSAAILTAIINSDRPLPTKGKYRVTRMQKVLAKEAALLEEQRSNLVKKMGEEIFEGEGEKRTSKGWQVSLDKMPEFVKEWESILGSEIDVQVEPIPLSQLDTGGVVEMEVIETAEDGSKKKVKKMVDPITISEIALLGDLISDEG
jgi:hypothetical protein